MVEPAPTESASPDATPAEAASPDATPAEAAPAGSAPAGSSPAGVQDHVTSRYTEMAALYAELFVDDLKKNDAPAIVMLATLAERARDVGSTVLDVGCGPGHVTEHLAGLGVHPIGIEPSSGFLVEARTRFPQRTFCRGDHANLSFATGGAAGVISRFSTIHKPPSELPPVFDEYARVLAPGGTLALWFFAADKPSEHGDGFDHTVATAYRADVDTMSAMLSDAGLTETERTFKTEVNQRSHAGLLATRI